MENTPEELEEKPSSNKDMWLFLIVLDVIVLCVLGFFLYRHFTAQVVSPTPAAAPVVAQTVEALPEIAEAEVITVEQTPAPVAPKAIEKPLVPAPVVEQPVTKQLETVEEVPVAPAPVEPVAPVAEEKPAPAKQSIIVLPVTNSKYRRVTFRWYEPAETVAIVSGFTNRQPKALKKVGDYWETTLSIAPGTYRFLYIIDGKNTTDPYAAQKDGRSVLVVK